MNISAPNTYTKTAIMLHWLIAVMIIGQLVGGKIMMWMDPKPLKFEIFQLHKSFGFIILGLSIARLLWRLSHKAPALPAGMKPIERIGAHASHIGFYVLMIGIPLSGWIMVSASTTRITTKIFKRVKVPDFPGVTRSEYMETLTENIHDKLAMIMIFLIGLHVAAALKHHFINKDDVLTRMVPRLGKKQ